MCKDTLIKGAKQATSTATSALSISTVDSLSALADRINAEHAQVLTAFNVGLDHALQAGRLLQVARRSFARMARGHDG